LNEDFHLTAFGNVGDLSLVKQDSSMYKISVQMQGLWLTVAESPERMYSLQVHHVVLILAESVTGAKLQFL
jgi:hypothetical protein